MATLVIAALVDIAAIAVYLVIVDIQVDLVIVDTLVYLDIAVDQDTVDIVDIQVSLDTVVSQVIVVDLDTVDFLEQLTLFMDQVYHLMPPDIQKELSIFNILQKDIADQDILVIAANLVTLDIVVFQEHLVIAD